ncbi:SusE domain-containing protein [Pedobacter endophyticus]|uniref:SusE domain-containing protein n=1 Tax=Pedobacter endophyticus TaxID=2789740 RepID=A0A7S9L1P6_9SPHI|nr:SusE domain-containing protein [Pedobacter endophyticus]QPH40857.1 SusE domain-containing protein [Pedobacter endophyticus]
MKTLKIVFGLWFACIALSSCKKDERALNENIGAVGALNLPSDQASIKLTPSDATATQQFKWAAATPDDGGLVLYEVAFDKDGGDFANPVFKVVSDGAGVQPQVTISHKDLTKIAALCGINSSSTGKVRWTVIASKASNAKPGQESRTLQLERPAGFAEVPTELYLTGSATEAGDDLAKALKFKKLEEGVFEIYTSLKPGTYQLTNKAGDGGRKFFAEGTQIKEGTSSVTVSGSTKAYYLKYDFNVAAVVEATEIQSVGLFMSAYAAEIGQLAYVANGVWQSGNIPVEFYQFSWGRDERYKFALHTSAGIKYMGSSNVNNVSPVGQSASYFYLNPVTNDQWNNTYKFNPAADNKSVKAMLNFGSGGAYTHSIVVQ